MSCVARKPVRGFPTRSVTNRAVLSRLIIEFEISEYGRRGIKSERNKGDAVTMQLICAFVFTYAQSRFAHDMAHAMFQAYSLLDFKSAYGIIEIMPV